MVKAIHLAEISLQFLCIIIWIMGAENYTPLLTVLAIIIHETGHVLAATLCNRSFTGIKTQSGGLRLLDEGMFYSYKTDAFIAFGGAALNFIAAFLLYFTSGGGYFFDVNISLGILNLLPIRDFDGGKIIRAFLFSFFTENITERFSDLLSFLALFSIWCISVYILLKCGNTVMPFAFSVSVFIKTIREKKTF